jgi:hypothetical protein
VVKTKVDIILKGTEKSTLKKSNRTKRENIRDHASESKRRANAAFFTGFIVS